MRRQLRIDPVTRYPGDPKVKELLNRFFDYSCGLAYRMAGKSAPDWEDFLQVARIKLLGLPTDQKAWFYKRSIRNAMLDFKRSYIDRHKGEPLREEY